MLETVRVARCVSCWNGEWNGLACGVSQCGGREVVWVGGLVGWVGGGVGEVGVERCKRAGGGGGREKSGVSSSV